MSESYTAAADLRLHPPLMLELPPVRKLRSLPIPDPRPGSLPPTPASLPYDPAHQVERQRATDAYVQAWLNHLTPLVSQVESWRASDHAQAQADEEYLAVEAMRMIQARRLDQKSGAAFTLYESLELRAAPLRDRAHNMPPASKS